jgi:hypothetical protein
MEMVEIFEGEYVSKDTFHTLVELFERLDNAMKNVTKEDLDKLPVITLVDSCPDLSEEDIT